MKLNTLLIFLLVLSLFSKAQSKQSDSDKKSDLRVIIDTASYPKCYYTVKKVSDSLWVVHKYDLQDSLLMLGTYKDEKLQVPEGTFKYYENDSVGGEKKYNRALNRFDITPTTHKYFLEKIAYFLNGERIGTWRYYTDKGLLLRTENYEKGMLNGQYSIYSIWSGKLYDQGNCIDGLKEGKWFSYSAQGDTTVMNLYRHDKIVRVVSYLADKRFHSKWTGGVPNYDFIAYLNEQLKYVRINETGFKVLDYNFMLDKSGKLVNPQIFARTFNPGVDTLIINAILTAPNWKPALRNNNEAEIRVPFYFNMYVSDDMHVHLSYYKKTDYFDDADKRLVYMNSSY